MQKLFLEPTKASPVQRLFQEWDVQDSLYVAIPGVMNRGEDAQQLAFFKDVIKATLPVLPVTIVVNSQERPFATYLREDYLPQFLSAQEMEKVSLFITQNNTCWIRDYAPIYGLDPRNGILMLDPRYGKAISDFLNMEIARLNADGTDRGLDGSLEAYAVNSMSWGDSFPSKLAHRLRGKTFRPIKVVRAPIYMEGGDFTQDGLGNVFLSLQTLHINGGDANGLRRAVRKYFGVKSVHFLRELPGDMIKHLDYVIKFTGPGIALIAQPHADSFGKTFKGELARDIKEALAFNQSYLEQNFPNVELVPVPMIPPSRDNETMLMFAIRDGLEKDIAYANKWINEAVYQSGPDFPLDNRVRAKVGAVILADTGLLDLRTPSRLDEALQHYFGRSLEQQLERHQDDMRYYRSYLNSLYLVNREGKERFLLPRYKPQDASEASWMPQVEKLVEDAYRKARPNAELVWIDADVMAQADGVIHCTTHVVPAWDDLPPYRTGPVNKE